MNRLPVEIAECSLRRAGRDDTVRRSDTVAEFFSDLAGSLFEGYLFVDSLGHIYNKMPKLLGQ